MCTSCSNSQVPPAALSVPQVHQIPKITKKDTDWTHKSHVPLLVKRGYGYIYIPTDIICKNSSLKKFTAWQIRLNYLWAKTNGLLSQTSPPACIVIPSWQSFYLSYSFIFSILWQTCISSFHVLNSGQRGRIKNSGVYDFISLKPALICGALRPKWFELIHWSGKDFPFNLA